MSSDGGPTRGPNGGPRVSWHQTLLRSWLLRPVRGTPEGSPLRVIATSSILWLAAWVVIDRWQRQPAPTFAADGIPVLAWYVLGVLGLGAVLQWTSRSRPAYAAALAVALGAIPLPLLLMSVAVYFLDDVWFWGAAVAVGLHSWAYLRRGLHAVTGRRQLVAALVGVAALAAFIVASDASDAIPDVWRPLEPPATVSEDALAEQESALFEQAARIDAELQDMRRDDGAAMHGFFLGFAGVGEQKVFAQEIDLAARVLAERYPIADRQLLLVNDERDLQRSPLASVSGLNYAIAGLAERMHLDDDVLFVSISSHGSEDPSIAVSNLQFPFTALTPEDLKGALDDAGIRWRVIIISACYAGGFIDTLRDARTIVITAAARDRTSFGCSNDADLTYFGEAFYRDALPHAKTLREAFETAKAAIGERERREHQTPSNPQAYFGAEIEAKLAGAQLEAAQLL